LFKTQIGSPVNSPAFPPSSSSNPFNGLSGIDFLPAPAKYTGEYCSKLSDKNLCCNDTQFTVLEQAFTIADNMVKNAISNVTDLFNKYEDKLVTQLAGMLTLMGIQVDQKKLTDDITSLFNTVKNDVLPSAQVCVDSYLGYLQGMVCYVCLADDSKYFAPSTNTLTFTDNVCDNVFNGCNGFFVALEKFKNSALDTMKDLISSSPNGAQIAQSIDQVKNQKICQMLVPYADDNCRKYTCNAMLSGLVPIQVTPKIPGIPNIGGGGAGGGGGGFPTPYPGGNNNNGFHHAMFSSLMVPATSVLTEPVNAVKSAFLAATQQQVTVAYGSNGYDATGVGCSSHFAVDCTKEMNPASATVYIIIGVVCGVVVLGAIAFVVVRRRRRQQQHALLGPQYTATGGE